MTTEITSGPYAGALYNAETGLLESGDYAGFPVAPCRAEQGYVAIVSEDAGEDKFSSDDILKIQELLEIDSASNKIILNSESRTPGRICIYSNDRFWAKQMEARVSVPWLTEGICESRLGSEEKCELLEGAFHMASGEEGFFESFGSTVPVGLAFAVPTGLGVFIGFLMKGKMAALPPLFINCDDPSLQLYFPDTCSGKTPES